MHKSPGCKEYELICVIVNFGLGSDVLRFSKQHGINGGTIYLGKGTIKNAILEFLEISESRKEIVLMASEATTAYNALEEINEHFKLSKPNHGIAFSTSVMSIFGTDRIQCKGDNESRGVEKTMYNLIMVVVDRGKAEAVTEAAAKAGSRGGTIIHARGSSIHETSKVFSMDIEPEKEIVLIISDMNKTDEITASINEQLQINEPGNGIIFVQDINKAYGLY